SLLEQERPNIFTSSIANVGPNESIDVTIEFQDTVPFDGAQFALRFPLVVAPRYVPGDDGECDGRAGGLSMTVADGDRIRPPLSAAPAVNPVRLSVELDPGFALASLYSPSHRIAIEAIDPFVQLVTTAEDTGPAGRDFE